MTSDPQIKAIEEALAAPWPAAALKFRPGAVARDGKTALALPYVDARLVQERLDQVVGVLGWKTSFKVLDGGCVVCTLSLRVGGEWISKEDVGSPSEQPDAGDRTKSAFSDALKRAAVAFGIARYLYQLPPIWAAYDGQRKRFTETPRLPGTADVARGPAPQKSPAGRPGSPAPATEPTIGQKLLARLQARDAELAQRYQIPRGRLLDHVQRTGTAAGLPDDLKTWDAAGVKLAAAAIAAFEAGINPSPTTAAPQPAPAGDRDPAEVISQAERQDLLGLMREGSKVAPAADWSFSRCRTFLGLGEEYGLGDLTHGQYLQLRAGLQKRIAAEKAKAPASPAPQEAA